jgi:hypothetical protein
LPSPAAPDLGVMGGDLNRSLQHFTLLDGGEVSCDDERSDGSLRGPRVPTCGIGGVDGGFSEQPRETTFEVYNLQP